jgi:hypothetical protein
VNKQVNRGLRHQPWNEHAPGSGDPSPQGFRGERVRRHGEDLARRQLVDGRRRQWARRLGPIQLVIREMANSDQSPLDLGVASRPICFVQYVDPVGMTPTGLVAQPDGFAANRRREPQCQGTGDSYEPPAVRGVEDQLL